LLAVHAGLIKYLSMKNIFPLLAASLLAAPVLAAPETATFDEAQKEQIGCIAVLGLLAYDQGRGLSQEYPDVRQSGKKWAGVTGDKIAFDSKQDPQVVAFAIKLAVKAEQDAAINYNGTLNYSDLRIKSCVAMMDADDVAMKAPSKLLPKPVK
jgi:hypothetical protein